MRRALVIVTGALAVLVLTGCSGPRSTETGEVSQVAPAPAPTMAATGQEGIAPTADETPGQAGEVGEDPPPPSGSVTTTVTGAPAPAPDPLAGIEDELGEFEELDSLLAELDDLLADLDASFAETEGDVNP